MDAAIYHPTRTSFFSVRGGYVFEYSLDGVQLSTSKFVNPCFSKSCMAYDAVHDKIWVGTMGDWAAGRAGDPGGALPSQTNGALYRINPATLALEQVVYPNTILFGQLDFVGPGYTYNMPTTNPFRNPPTLIAVTSGFYDLICVGSKLWACMFSDDTDSAMVSFDTTNPVGSNLLAPVTIGQRQAITQCTVDLANVPSRIWFNACDDLLNSLNPIAINSDWTQTAANTIYYNTASFPAPNGAAGAIAYSPVGGGFVYVVQLTGTALVKYNVNGAINSTPALAGVGLGGQPIRLRFNTFDNLLYIPMPASNIVVAFNPATDTVSHIYIGLDAPHDCVFSPTRKYAVQFGTVGLKELL